MSNAAVTETEGALRRGQRLRRMGEARAALQAFEVHLSQDPENLQALCGRSLAKADLGRVDEAVDDLYDAMFIDGEDVEVVSAMADCMRARGEPETAICYYDQALETAPDSPDLRWRRALCLLTDNQLQAGFEALAEQWPAMLLERGGALVQGIPSWTEGPVQGKRVLVHLDKYVGNNLQFLRFLRELSAAGAQAVMAENRDLELLLAGSMQVCFEAQPQADLQVALTAIPGLLGVGEEALAPVPYLKVEGEAVLSSQSRRVGISWHGSPEEPTDLFRAPSVADFSPLSDLEGVDLYGMDVGEVQEQAALELLHPPVDLRRSQTPLTALATLIRELDAVVTADTELAHLAGALGVRALLVLPASCSWRWMYWRQDSPWYPAVTLFRQPRAGDWGSVFEKVRQALAQS